MLERKSIQHSTPQNPNPINTHNKIYPTPPNLPHNPLALTREDFEELRSFVMSGATVGVE